MIVFPPLQSSERRLSEIDRFCIQTQETGKVEAAKRVRFIASTLGVVCVALLLCLGLAISRANAVERQRDSLMQELRTERAARIKATVAVEDAEMTAANEALSTRVRGDIADERMLEQERRSAELERLAAQVERQKLVEANCVTPRSILAAAGL